MLDRHEEALKCYDEALAIDPTNVTAQQGKPVGT
jgi:tetratricopeptide (TPR) repeat protein